MQYVLEVAKCVGLKQRSVFNGFKNDFFNAKIRNAALSLPKRRLLIHNSRYPTNCASRLLICIEVQHKK